MGAVWHVGGVSAALGSPPAGSPGMSSRFHRTGTVAPTYSAKFNRKETDAEQYRMHEARLALALDIDPASRIFGFSIPQTPPDTPSNVVSPSRARAPLTWKDDAWSRGFDYPPTSPKAATKKNGKFIPAVPFRVLDAPFLRDDYYSTILAYCPKARVLAVGLSSRVYLWSEQHGVTNPPLQQASRHNFVTSLSFSSETGGRSILAVGRRQGQFYLWSTFDQDVRFKKIFPVGVACVSFRDTPSIRSSELFPRISVNVEHLAVGDDAGNVWYYTVEWTTPKLRKRYGWDGNMTLVARIAAHKQQVCGLAWSPDGKFFATGSNDNICLVFDMENILAGASQPEIPGASAQRHSWRTRQLDQLLLLRHRNYSTISLLSGSMTRNDTRDADSGDTEDYSSESSQAQTVIIRADRERHRLKHHAAVKAISFAPWEPALLATGGGSSDRCIRFWHAPTGALLATINVYAQVTSLIWSKTRRELAATFGYAHPRHPYRIAVFAWPSCEQVLAIPWATSEDMEYGITMPGRAIWAISYPGGPSEMLAYAQSRMQTGAESPDIETHGRSLSGANRQSTHGRGDNPPSMSRVAHTQGHTWFPRTEREGCIVIACSDESIRFQEVWGGEARSLRGGTGVFGGKPDPRKLART
ncbi:predicted protein [Uncinocarpus reesii 1704]|uniref:Uncharacterized protein n=1 Tax=Uncinocarpus reesii (strain UAMH 1704) TaxID=336963 RepID=C4JRP4_UNCRE|nr:uncharacterized protein UREG_05133 [Uncinocarpus reesii 1704]EEP80291.1 predicted protein [Uncinocarpus reesii 1704]